MLRNLLSSNVFCPPPLPTQQVELIRMEMSTRHLFLNSSYLFSICFPCFKKNIKKIITLDPRYGTLDPRHGTLDPRHKDRLKAKK